MYMIKRQEIRLTFVKLYFPDFVNSSLTTGYPGSNDTASPKLGLQGLPGVIKYYIISNESLICLGLGPWNPGLPSHF